MAEVADAKPTPTTSPTSPLHLEASAPDTRSGFDAVTRTFRSLRPAADLPPEDRPLSVTSFAFLLLSRSPTGDRLAVVDASTGASIRFRELGSRVRHLAAALQGPCGVSKGDVVFVLSPARVEVPVIYLALFSIGAVVAPANPIATAGELARLVELTRPSVALATSDAAAKLPARLKVISLDSDEFRAYFDGRAGAGEVPDVEVRQSDPAAIQFSSGTTGPVKAAALAHRSFISMMAGSHRLLPPPEERRPHVTLLAAPMFHSLGFYFALKGVALGETTVLMGCRRGGVDDIFKAAAVHRATQMTASPPVVSAMASSGLAGRLDLGALRRVLCGGAPLHESEARRFMAMFPGVELAQGYGSTEAGGVSEMVNMVECRRVRSVGRLCHRVEAKIVAYPDGCVSLLPAGQHGELWVRGPAVMIGYVGDEEANASSFDSKGWLRTGDLCYFDRDGYLYVVDRLKEMIKYKAYQVPPAELESLLQSLPGVADSAVIPYPHEEVGQIPMAFVVRRHGMNLTEAQVMDFVAKQVTAYKKIRKVAFVDSIPRSSTGKILRRELRNLIDRNLSMAASRL